MGDNLQKYSEVIQKYVSNISPIKQHSSLTKARTPDSVLLSKQQKDSLDALWQEDCAEVEKLVNHFQVN